jgi:hypothetical protein
MCSAVAARGPFQARVRSGTLGDPLPGELVVELPLSALLHQHPDDVEPGGLSFVYGANVHGSRGRVPTHLIHLQEVDSYALYLG